MILFRKIMLFWIALIAFSANAAIETYHLYLNTDAVTTEQCSFDAFSGIDYKISITVNTAYPLITNATKSVCQDGNFQPEEALNLDNWISDTTDDSSVIEGKLPLDQIGSPQTVSIVASAEVDGVLSDLAAASDDGVNPNWATVAVVDTTDTTDTTDTDSTDTTVQHVPSLTNTGIMVLLLLFALTVFYKFRRGLPLLIIPLALGLVIYPQQNAYGEPTGISSGGPIEVSGEVAAVNEQTTGTSVSTGGSFGATTGANSAVVVDGHTDDWSDDNVLFHSHDNGDNGGDIRSVSAKIQEESLNVLIEAEFSSEEIEETPTAINFAPKELIVNQPQIITIIGNNFTSPIYVNLEGSGYCNNISVLSAHKITAECTPSEVGKKRLYIVTEKGGSAIEGTEDFYVEVASEGYLYPFEEAIGTYPITQYPHGSVSHTGKAEFAYDFGSPIGAWVVATASGTVRATKEDSNIHCGTSACANDANYVIIAHDNNVDSLYLHLDTNSVIVSPGDEVKAGQRIAQSGHTGWSTGAHLHFQLQEFCGVWWCQSIEIEDCADDWCH